VGDSGTVVYTTNGGISWNEQQTNVTSLLHHIQFVSPLTGFVSGEQSTALETFDGGLTWQIVSDSGTTSFIVYWIQQGLGTILISDPTFSFQNFTVDGGMTWFPGGFPVIYSNDVCGVRAVFPNSVHNYYWDVGILGKALWISINEENAYLEFAIDGQTEDTLDLNAVSLERGVEPLSLWAVGDKGWIINSVDTGKTWQTISNNISVDLYEVSFPMQDLGWVVGNSGAILYTTNGGVSFIDEENLYEIKTKFSLIQNYPNPFNPVTKIKYSVSSVTLQQAQSDILVTLKVYDILGREVATLISEEKPAGEYEVEFNAVNLPSGIYFYQLKSGEYIETRKMVLLK
jgi:hypothetical protein